MERKGTVAQVLGPVVDVAFPNGALPEINEALTEYCSAGFPHSEISGSTAICASPKLIAACHVLRRLLMPRHSPCALNSLTYFHKDFHLLERSLLGSLS